MSQTPQREIGSKAYQDAWRAINILIRSDGSWSGRERNLCYLNRGDGRFEDVAFVSGLDLDADGRAFAPLDLDRDGDLDLIFKNRSGRQLRAFRNDLAGGGRRLLSVRLEGRESNRDGVGARIWLETDGRTQMREIVSGSGFLSQRSRRAEFGLLDAERPRRLRVRWPGGREQEFSRFPKGGEWVVVEGASKVREFEPSPGKFDGVAPAPEAETTPGTWLAEPPPAPDFSLPSLEGGAIRLSEQRGSKTLVNFWATWCPPCRTELADLSAHARELAGAGVTVLAISVDEPGNGDAVRAFAGEQGLPFPVLFANDAVVNAYTVLNERLFDRRRNLAIPTSFLVDEDGRVVKAYRGQVAAAAILKDASAEAAPAPFDGRWIASGPRRDFAELGAAYAERGLAEPARQAFEEALARDPESPELLNNFAGALLEAGEPERAEELLRRSLALEPRQTEARINLATLLLQRENAREAAGLLREALEAQPDDVQALDLLGSALFTLGEASAAERAYRRALDLDPEHAKAHENLGSLLASLGRSAEAIAELEEARRLGADSARLHTNLGVLYLQRGMPTNGLLAFERAIEADPEDVGARLNLAMYYLQAGLYAAAREAAARARALDSQRPEAAFLEAQAAAALGDRDEARRLLDRTVAAHPEFQPARELLERLR